MDEETVFQDESDGSSVGFVVNIDVPDGDRNESETLHTGLVKSVDS